MAISSAHEQEERGDDQHEAKEDAPDQEEGAQLIVGDSGVLRERELRSAGPTGRGGREQAGSLCCARRASPMPRSSRTRFSWRFLSVLLSSDDEFSFIFQIKLNS